MDDQLKILVLEDDTAVIATFELLLSATHDVTYVSTCNDAITAFTTNTFDLICLDVNLPDGSGIDVLRMIQSKKPEQEVIMTTAQKEATLIVQAMRLGATDYITKPIESALLYKAISKIQKTRRLVWEKTVLLQKVENSQRKHHGIVGQSIAMRHICEIVAKLKGTGTSILIQGESGVGKEVITNAIHEQEENPVRPFVTVNCAAIPENLLESELFGHEKGAFTGATQSRIGKFVQADGGDIFLDEIACMSPHLQAKLLRVLQDKLVEPLGSSRQIKSNFRVIAATNEDIKSLIERKAFRQDLYFRLQGVEIYIPPLRARTEDIPLLVEHILKELVPKFGRRHFTQEAIEVMCQYEWPGNVRELKNTVENILILTSDEVIDTGHLPPIIKQPSTTGKKNGFMLSHLRDNMKNYERDVIVSALKRHRGNKSRASKDLGISRSILYRKMKGLDMTESDIY